MWTRRRWLGAWTGLALLVGLGTAAALHYHANRLDHHLRQGREALQRRNWAAARQQAEWLERAGHPDHAHLVRGQIDLHHGDLAGAILEYNAIRHDRPEVLVEASRAYGLAFLSVGKLVEAERFLLYVLDVSPDDVDAHRGLARVHYERGALTRAVSHLEKWSRLVPEAGEPHRWLGLAYDGLGADAPAVRHYRLALEKGVSPRLAREVTVELAESLVKQRQFAEALACLDRGDAESLRDAPPAPELRAESLYGVGRGADAARILDQILREGTASPRALRVRALIHAAAGETSDAVALLEKALRTDPHDHASRYQLAQAYQSLGRSEEAAEQHRLLEKTRELLDQLADLNQQASEKPTDPRVRRRLAEVCMRLGKPDLAQMWLQAAESCPLEPGPGASP
jgi:tetratricopeptide (TPR) repeat protein